MSQRGTNLEAGERWDSTICSLAASAPADAATDWIPTPEDVERFEADPNIVADQSENWAERRGTLDALETRFNNVTRALLKLEDGMYGTCEICTGNIEGDRLNVNPAARTCKKHLEDEVALSN